MDVKKYFEYNPDLELTVAQIGINKWDWEFTRKYDESYAKKVMTFNKFDVLPVSIEGKINHYYKTNSLGDYSNISVVEIIKDEIIYYRLSFIDLIRRMTNEGRYHYFLSDSNEILGLISINNLNCLAVYNYIYQLTASLEQLVSNYLKNNFDDSLVLEWLLNSSDEQANSVAKEFIKLQIKNVENSIFHHLFFPTLGTLLKSANSVIEIDKPALIKYRTKFCAGNLYWEIRNLVSHPVKPLFVNELSVKKINELISDYIEIKRILG